MCWVELCYQVLSFNCVFQHLNSELMKKLAAFDPLGKDTKVDIHKANDRLKGMT